VQQTIRRSPVDHAVLDVFPQNAGALFVAAAEQAAAAWLPAIALGSTC